MVEVLEQIPQKSVPQHSPKSTKRASKSAFADFINNLGKTTSAKNSAETQGGLPRLGEATPRNGNLLDSAPKAQNDKMGKMTETDNIKADSAPKDKILSNILKGKNEEILQNSAPSPLESILSRPKATRTKLNATPEIKQPDAPNEGRFNNRDAVMRSLKGTNISFENSADDKGFMKITENSAESPKNRSIPSVSDLQSEGQKMAQNNAKADFADLTPKNLSPKTPQSIENKKDLSPKTPQSIENKKDLSPKSAPSVESKGLEIKSEKENLENMAQKNLAQKSTIPNNTKAEIPTPKENNSKAQNATNQGEKIDEPKNKNANLIESSAELEPHSTKSDEISQNLTNEKVANASVTPNLQNLQNVAQESQIKASDSTKSSQNPQISQNPQEVQDAQNTKDSTAQNFAKLGIANTLKYGAFKAFDALSLLKPSDGKKLSELIKKADELSLNLQNIKYTKMGENKGIFENLKAQNKSESEAKMQANPVLDSAKNSQNLVKNQSREAQPLKASSGEGEGVVREGEGSDFAIQAPSPSLKENARGQKGESNADLSAQERKENRDSSPKAQNDKVKEVSDSIKVDSTKTNFVDSKSAESPLKNALETENNDVKPINFKTQNIAESKKETSLDFAKDATKDAIKDAKDAPKQTQENTPFTSTQGASKIANQIFDARETMRHFAHNLRNEIQNYKPPLSKITIELQPAHLGNVEVSITSQGKNIQIQLHAQQNTLNLFIQNQSDLRTALFQAGYDNVAMSFSNGAQMGFSDNSGKWRYESAQKSRNTFSLNDKNDENDEVFEIMITNNYA